MPCDEIRRGNFGCPSFLADSEQQFLLPLGEHGDHALVNALLCIHGGMKDAIRLFGYYRFTGNRLFIEAVQQSLHIPRMTFEQSVNTSNALVGNPFTGLFEMLPYEFVIGSLLDGAEVQERSTLVERPGSREENILHHVALASGKNEVRVGTFLYMRTQYGFHIFFRITGDLLELVNGHQTGFVRRFEIREKFLQRYLRLAYLPDTDVEYGLSGDGIELESRTQGGDSREKSLCKLPAFGFQRIEDVFAEHEHQLLERTGSVNVHEERVIFPGNPLLMETMFDKSGLAHATGRYDDRITPVYESLRKLLGFDFSVAEIVGGNVAADNEGIFQYFHGFK